MEIAKVVLTSVLSVASLFLIAKVMGHKQISQLDFFDYITGITIGSVAAELATELEKPWKPLIAMAVYGIIAVLLSILTEKSPRTRKFINGTPTIIMNDGKIYRSNMKKAKLELSEFMMMCRQEGYFDLGEIQAAIFEYNGRLTILPTSRKRPIHPEDLGLEPQPAAVFTELIMDGRILSENLKRRGLDEKWLQKQLDAQEIRRAKDVFLAICDDQNQLTIYKTE